VTGPVRAQGCATMAPAVVIADARCAAQHDGRSDGRSTRRMRPVRRGRTSARYSRGSTPARRHEPRIVYAIAARSPPASEPAKRKFLCLCGAPHHRKNFPFVGNPGCGDNLAGLYSLIAACDLHDVDPLAYLRDVLLRIDTRPASQIDDLLPIAGLPQFASSTLARSDPGLLVKSKPDRPVRSSG